MIVALFGLALKQERNAKRGREKEEKGLSNRMGTHIIVLVKLLHPTVCVLTAADSNTRGSEDAEGIRKTRVEREGGGSLLKRKPEHLCQGDLVMRE